jgi:hypothetical protein
MTRLGFLEAQTEARIPYASKIDRAHVGNDMLLVELGYVRDLSPIYGRLRVGKIYFVSTLG